VLFFILFQISMGSPIMETTPNKNDRMLYIMLYSFVLSLLLCWTIFLTFNQMSQFTQLVDVRREHEKIANSFDGMSNRNDEHENSDGTETGELYETDVADWVVNLAGVESDTTPYQSGHTIYPESSRPTRFKREADNPTRRELDNRRSRRSRRKGKGKKNKRTNEVNKWWVVSFLRNRFSCERSRARS
jgi:hypothetical protein